MSEEEEAGAAAKKEGDEMKEAIGASAGLEQGEQRRPVKGLPRSSLPAATTTAFDADEVRSSIEAAKLRAAELVEGLKRPQAAYVAGKGKGLVQAVKTVVA